MKFILILGLISLMVPPGPLNGELIQHSWQAESVEHGTDVVHKDHHIHLEESPHLSDDTLEYEHQAFEFIEVPDSTNEIALKAKTYADAQNFAKKFGFKNLGRVPNLPNTYNLIREKSKKRKVDEQPHDHKGPKPVWFNNQHRIYFLEDQVPLKRVKRGFLPLDPIPDPYGYLRNLNRRRFAFDQRAQSVPVVVPTVAVAPNPRQFIFPFHFFQDHNKSHEPEKPFYKPVVFSHDPTPNVRPPLEPFANNKPANFDAAQAQQASANMRIEPDYNRDQNFKDQWYLDRNCPLRVRDAWRMGYTGKGVVVTIIDDGLEWNHTDLIRNYDPEGSTDINGRDSDPMPSYLDDNAHGTRCAGEVAMQAGNGKCGVGIAYDAKIGGIRLLDGNVVDIKEAQAFLFNYHHIHIYSSSWGPNDDGETVDGPKPLAREALQRGAEHGRNGLGAIYIWASGNGGKKGDNCNCDGYVGSIYTIAFGSVGQNGHFPWYGERCSAMHAVTYSSNSAKERKIATTDIKNQCTIEHSGTSAAAPLASGILALVLEANPYLTWRDVQHLISWTSHFEPMMHSPGWRRNAAGLVYNDRFGFGMLNAVELITKAKTWRTVPPMHSCVIDYSGKFPIYIDDSSPTVIYFDAKNCRNTRNEVNYIEQVQVQLTVKLPERGQLEMFLVSPSGTGSVILTERENDASSSGFNRWNFTSVHFWGEKCRDSLANKPWKLYFKIQRGAYGGEVSFARLFVHGTNEKPNHMYEQPFRTYPQFRGDIAKVLDDNMPFDNELARIIPQEDLQKQTIIDWSKTIQFTNQHMNDEDFFPWGRSGPNAGRPNEQARL